MVLRSVSICVDLRLDSLPAMSDIVSECHGVVSVDAVSFVRSAISCVRDHVVDSVPMRFDAITDIGVFDLGHRVRFAVLCVLCVSA